MKKQFNSVLPEDFKIANRMCIVCGKKTEGYGCWHEGYTCSRKCEEVKESQPRNFGEHHEHQMVHRSGSGAGDEPDASEGTDSS